MGPCPVADKMMIAHVLHRGLSFRSFVWSYAVVLNRLFGRFAAFLIFHALPPIFRPQPPYTDCGLPPCSIPYRPMPEAKRQTTYADAGVSIQHGNALVERIKPYVKNTIRPGAMGSVGGFGALFDIASLNYREPVLVSATDGVGTKLKLAMECGLHDTIGIDLVAMCVNDLLVQGAEPLFFLDYYACSSLEVDVADQVVKGIAEGCRQAGCALVGGETAEMPGMYQDGEYDLAGFCVGAVEKAGIIDGRTVSEGNILIGLAASGPHANGYSLIRKLLADSSTQLHDDFQGQSFLNVLLAPTRIYARPVLGLIKQVRVKAMAHITGGGLIENLPRALPTGMQAGIDAHSWQWPDIFHWLQQTGDIARAEMYRTFNCGVGMVLIVDADDAAETIELLTGQGEIAWALGTIQKQSADAPRLVFT